MTTQDSRDTAAGRTRTVQLRYATLPSVCGAIAVHHWFAAFDGPTGDGERWEVWQSRNAGGIAWGHVYRNLMHPDQGVGGGRCVVAAEWEGEAAESLYEVLSDPARYPHRKKYRAWPGPNSNTYAAWALQQAGIGLALDPRAVGKDYLGIFCARRSVVNKGYQVETPLLGFKLGPAGGAELHLLGLTFGLEPRPLAFNTPLGRLPLLKPR